MTDTPSHPLQTSDELLIALKGLQAESFALPACIPSYSTEIAPPEGFTEPESFDVSAVSMPPELYDIDEDRWQAGEGRTGNLKLFAEDVSFIPSHVRGTPQDEADGVIR